MDKERQEQLRKATMGLRMRIFDIPHETCLDICKWTQARVCERTLGRAQKEGNAETPMCFRGWWYDVIDKKAAVLCACPAPAFPPVTADTLIREYYTEKTEEVPCNFIVAVVKCTKCGQELHLAQIITDQELGELKKPPPAPLEEAKDVVP